MLLSLLILVAVVIVIYGVGYISNRKAIPNMAAPIPLKDRPDAVLGGVKIKIKLNEKVIVGGLAIRFVEVPFDERCYGGSPCSEPTDDIAIAKFEIEPNTASSGANQQAKIVYLGNKGGFPYGIPYGLFKDPNISKAVDFYDSSDDFDSYYRSLPMHSSNGPFVIGLLNIDPPPDSYMVDIKKAVTPDGRLDPTKFPAGVSIAYEATLIVSDKNSDLDGPVHLDSIATSTDDTIGDIHELSEFSFIRKGMPFSKIESMVGKPDLDAGSGLYVYSYNLIDGSIVFFGFSDLNSLMYIKHADANTGKTVDLTRPASALEDELMDTSWALIRDEKDMNDIQFDFFSTTISDPDHFHYDFQQYIDGLTRLGQSGHWNVTDDTIDFISDESDMPHIIYSKVRINGDIMTVTDSYTGKQLKFKKIRSDDTTR